MNFILLLTSHDIQLNIMTKGLEFTAALTGFQQHVCRSLLLRYCNVREAVVKNVCLLDHIYTLM